MLASGGYLLFEGNNSSLGPLKSAACAVLEAKGWPSTLPGPEYGILRRLIALDDFTVTETRHILTGKNLQIGFRFFIGCEPNTVAPKLVIFADGLNRPRV